MTRPAADIVKVQWTGTGNSTPITLGSAVSGFNAFPSALDGQRITYSIEHQTSPEREAGTGVYTHSGTTLTREVVSASTNGGSRVVFSPGTKHVRIVAIASDVFENRATTDPTTEGRSLGYTAGRSRWLNTSTGKLWICLNDDDTASPSTVSWQRLITADEVGELAIPDDAVTTAKIANSAVSTIKIADAAVTNAKLADMAEATFKMRAIGTGTGAPIDGTATNAKAALEIALADLTDAGEMAGFAVADQGEAEAGVDNDVGMTPLRTRQQAATFPYFDTSGSPSLTVIDNTHAGYLVDFDVNLTLDNTCAPVSSAVKRGLILRNTAVVSRTLTVEAGAGGTGTINGAVSYTVPSGGIVQLWFMSNPGDEPVIVAIGDAAFVDLGIGDGSTFESAAATRAALAIPEVIIIAVSDETTALTATGNPKVTFRMPFAMTLSTSPLGVRASVTTAPTGAALTVDINQNGASILSTKLTIDATEETSTTAATPAVISAVSLADDAEITIDIDTIGSTIAGAGLKVQLRGVRT